ncbi:MAG: hypothetical protein RL033_1750 [Pseudomonadota bacterium]
MRFWYGTVTATAALLMGCDSGAERVAIVAHYVPACAPEADSAQVQLELIALGDFERSNDNVSILDSAAARQALSLPPGTRAVELSTLGDRGFWGTGTLDAQQQISVLLWPREQSCALAGLAAQGDQSWLLGMSTKPAQLLCLASVPADDAPAGVAIDLGTARGTPLAPGRGLATPRAFASLSSLGERMLIAGGSDPESGRPRADAELFDPATLTPEPELLRLAVPRTRHAAVVLPSGASLLIGGESADGDALGSVELVSDDASRSARSLELLGTPRIQPSALLLDSGRILVGGGFVWTASTRDPRAARQPIASVELLSVDLTDGALVPMRLDPAALDRAFVALPGGGALAVGGCDPIVRADPCLPCGNGPGCISRDVWWIEPRGGAAALPALPESLAAAQPRLVAAAEGAPWLLANGRLARFDPWQARFVTIAESGYAPVQAPLDVGPGSFVWLQRQGDTLELLGQHASQRGPLTQDVAPLLVGSGRAVVPHRPPTSAVPEADVTLRYGTASGLELAGAAAVASITDTDYADFTLDLTLAEGPAPLLRLSGKGAAAGESASFGGLECPWPEVATADGAAGPTRLRVQRAGDAVSLLLADATAPGPSGPCRRTLPERVAIELAGTSLGTSRLLRIEVRRSLD